MYSELFFIIKIFCENPVFLCCSTKGNVATNKTRYLSRAWLDVCNGISRGHLIFFMRFFKVLAAAGK